MSLPVGGHLDDAALLALLAGDLAPPEAARADLHLSSCASCTRSHEAFRVVQAGMCGSGIEPSPFASARMKRSLTDAIAAGHSPRPRLVRQSRAVAAVAIAALSGAAVAMTAIRSATADPAAPARSAASDAVEPPALEPVRVATAVAHPLAIAPAPIEVAQPAQPGTPPRAGTADASEASPAVVRRGVVPSSQPAADARSRAPAKTASTSDLTAGTRVAIATDAARASYEDRGQLLEAAWSEALAAGSDADWIALGDAFAQAGDADRAADAWIRGLSSSSAQIAAQRLSTATREGVLEASALIDRLAAEDTDSAEALRLRCEWGLRHRGDRGAVESCQAFGRAFPAHPAVRTLAMAAGQVAESRLDDLPLAIAEYSRALMVSEYAGVPSSEALLARSRARAKAGEREEAQADLRLYLHVAPEAYNRSDIRTLADSLGVPAP